MIHKNYLSVTSFDKKQNPILLAVDTLRCRNWRNGVKIVIVDKNKKLMVKLRKLLIFQQVCDFGIYYRVVSYSLAYTNKHNWSYCQRRRYYRCFFDHDTRLISYIFSKKSVICKIDFALENTDENDFLMQYSVNAYMYQWSYEQYWHKSRKHLSHWTPKR